MEKWLPVVGFEAFYEVSDLGQVRRIYQTKSGRDLHKPLPFLLTPSKNINGYMFIYFFDGKDRTVHSLVCAAFLGPRPPRADVSHENGDKTCNRLENLKYRSRSDHLKYSHKLGERVSPQKPGENNSNARLTDAQVAEIKWMLANGINSQAEIASKFGISQQNISRIHRGLIWNHVNALSSDPTA